MHQEVIGKVDGLIIDHINGDGLHNYESNLRHVTHRENSQNHVNANYSSKYPGVCYDKRRNNWKAYARINRKFINIGNYNTEEIAYKHYLEEINRIQ